MFHPRRNSFYEAKCVNGKAKTSPEFGKDLKGKPISPKKVKCQQYKVGQCINCPYKGNTVVINNKAYQPSVKQGKEYGDLWKKVFMHKRLSSAYGKNCSVKG